MTDVNPKNEFDHSGTSPDPYLRSFLRQAVAIIAAERGLTDTCQAKLQKIASQLGLSDRAYQESLQQLKSPENSLGLNRYEQEFVKLISNELKSYQGDVLSIANEKRLVELAATKFQIPHVRAHQLIQKTAEQNHVGIISHADAQVVVGHLIEDSVGQRVSIAELERNRLMKIGENWGIATATTQKQINRLIRGNVRSRRAAQLKRFAFYATCTITILGMTWLLNQAYLHLTAKTPAPAVVTRPANEPEFSYPLWWTESMRIYLSSNNLTDQQLSQPTADTEITASTFEQPGIYLNLLDSTFDQPPSFRLDNFVADAFYKSPNPESPNSITHAITTEILNALNINAPNRNLNGRKIRRSLRAVDMAVGLVFQDRIEFQTADESARLRQVNLINQLPIKPEINQTKESYQQLLTQQTALKSWGHALRVSSADAKSTAAILADLERLDPDGLPAINELRLKTCHTIVQRTPIQWNNIKASIAKSIALANDSNIKTWIETALQPNQSSDLREYLFDQLATKLDLHASGNASIPLLLADHLQASPAAALKNQIQCSQTLSSIIQNAEQKLRVLGVYDPRPPTDEFSDAKLAESILLVTEINNQILNWLRNESTVAELENCGSIANRLATIEFPAAMGPTPSQQRELIEQTGRLRDRDPNKRITRNRALAKIGELAGKFPDVSQELSEQLANYLLTARDFEERLNIDRIMPKFSNWTQLKLALADELDSSTLSAMELNELLNRLKIARQQNQSLTADWRMQTKNRILKHCYSELLLKHKASNQYLTWSAFESFYGGLVRNRLIKMEPTNNLAQNQSLNRLLASASQHESRWIKNHVNIVKQEPSSPGKWILASAMVAEIVLNSESIDANHSQPIDSAANNSYSMNLLLGEVRLLEALKIAFQNRRRTLPGVF